MPQIQDVSSVAAHDYRDFNIFRLKVYVSAFLFIEKIHILIYYTCSGSTTKGRNKQREG